MSDTSYIELAHGVPETHPERRGTLNWSPKVNYIEARGGLPPYVNSIATALEREGHPRSVAIQIARRVVEKTCATGHWGGRPNMPVSGAIRAAACSAHARMKAIDKGAKLSADCQGCSSYIELAGPSTSERKKAESKGQAMQGGRFPIRNTADLKKAIRAVGRAKGSHDSVRRFIIWRAKALGASHMIPDNWKASGAK